MYKIIITYIPSYPFHNVKVLYFSSTNSPIHLPFIYVCHCWLLPNTCSHGGWVRTVASSILETSHRIMENRIISVNLYLPRVRVVATDWIMLPLSIILQYTFQNCDCHGWCIGVMINLTLNDYLFIYFWIFWLLGVCWFWNIRSYINAYRSDCFIYRFVLILFYL